METVTKNKQERIDFKINSEQKRIIRKASKIKNTSITNYIIDLALIDAKKTIENNERILATKRDQEIFFNEIMNPSPPNEYLIKRMREHRKKYGSRI